LSIIDKALQDNKLWIFYLDGANPQDSSAYKQIEKD
jgi:hypothetical protein